MLKRLGDVIIGPEVEPFDLVALLVLPGEQDHVAGPGVRVGLDLLTKDDAIHVGQSAIEDGQVPPRRAERGPSLLARGVLEYVEPRAGEQQPEQSPNGRIVIHNRDRKLLPLGHTEPCGKEHARVEWPLSSGVA